MRYSGLAHPQEQVPVHPDTTLSLLLTAASPQVFDYPTGANLMRITAGSTLAVSAPVFLNPSSSGAAVPSTSGTVTTGSTLQQLSIVPGEARWYQIPGGSTSFSLISGSSNSVGIEFWGKHG